MDTQKRFGWIPSAPDYRDYKLKALSAEVFPAQADLRPVLSQVFDQGNLGSCTANAASTAYQFCLKNQRKHLFTPSRMFTYYNSRDMDGTIPYDVGSSMRTAIKSMKNTGVCSEQSWNYNMKSFLIRPHQKSYDEASKHTTVLYKSIDNRFITQLKSSITSGLPFIFGFMVYNSFMSEETSKTGKMTLPISMDYMLGGHAVTGVGYDDLKQHFIVQNSWGTGWGDKGYFYMPYSYITHPNLAMDFWQVTSVTF